MRGSLIEFEDCPGSTVVNIGEVISFSFSWNIAFSGGVHISVIGFSMVAAIAPPIIYSTNSITGTGSALLSITLVSQGNGLLGGHLTLGYDGGSGIGDGFVTVSATYAGGNTISGALNMLTSPNGVINFTFDKAAKMIYFTDISRYMAGNSVMLAGNDVILAGSN